MPSGPTVTGLAAPVAGYTHPARSSTAKRPMATVPIGPVGLSESRRTVGP